MQSVRVRVRHGNGCVEWQLPLDPCRRLKDVWRDQIGTDLLSNLRRLKSRQTGNWRNRRIEVRIGENELLLVRAIVSDCGNRVSKAKTVVESSKSCPKHCL